MKVSSLPKLAKRTVNYWGQYWLVYASALMLGIAAQNYNFSWITLVALMPVLVFIKLAHRRGWTQHDKLHMFLGGVVMFISSLGWIPKSDPVTWTPTEGSEARFALYCFYLIMITCFSVSWLAVAYVLSSRRRWIVKSDYRLYGLFALSVVATEWLRGLLVSLVIWSPDSTIGSQWGFGDLGFLSAATPFAYLGRSVGVYGVSLLVIALNVILLELIKKNPKPLFVGVPVFVALGLMSTLPYQSTEPTVRVGSVQLNAEITDEYMPGLLAAAKSSQLDAPVDLLVTPEYFNLFEMAEAKEREQALELITKPETVVVTSTYSKESGKPHPTNRQLFYSPDGQVLAWNDKTLLVPGGEYLPTGTQLGLKLIGYQSLLDEFNQYRAVSKGDDFEQVYTSGDMRLGSLACSGVVSPIQYRKLSAQQPNILTNSASLGIFGEGYEYFEQAKQMARFHAVANNKPFIQGAAHSTSYIIDRNGNWIVESSNPDSPVELIYADVELGNKHTLNSTIGDWPAYLSILAVGVIVLLGKQSRKQNPKK